MDVFDKFFQRYSYKFPKGYPDMNNSDDILLLENILGKLGINLNEMRHPFSYLSLQAQEIGKEIINKLNIPEEDIKGASKNKIIILTDIPRQEIFNNLEKLGYKRETTLSGSSAGGFIAPNGTQIIHKFKSLVAVGGAGIKNETTFVDAINNIIEQSTEGFIDIKIIANNKTLLYKKVNKAVSIGKEGEKKQWKGDVLLKTEEGDKSISIKQDGKFRWEGAITRYEDLYKKFLSKAENNEIPNLELKPDLENPRVLQMWNPNNDKPYGRIFIKDLPEFNDSEYLKSISFGKDNAVIVQRTFSNKDFSYNENNNQLKISATKIITSIDDFTPEDFPVLEFERNASKATKLTGVLGRGIILRISPQTQMLRAGEKANNLVLSYDDIKNIL